MRKIGTILLLLVTISSAQQHFYGIGLAHSNTAIFPESGNKYTIDLYDDSAYFITYRYMFNPSMGVASGLGHTTRGFLQTFIASNGAEYIVVTGQFDYLDLPVLFHYRNQKKVFIFTNIGFNLGLLLKANLDHPEMRNFADRRSTSRYKSLDLSGVLQVGFGFRYSKKSNVQLSVSYEPSVTDILNASLLDLSSIQFYGIYYRLGIEFGV